MNLTGLIGLDVTGFQFDLYDFFLFVFVKCLVGLLMVIGFILNKLS